MKKFITIWRGLVVAMSSKEEVLERTGKDYFLEMSEEEYEKKIKGIKIVDGKLVVGEDRTPIIVPVETEQPTESDMPETKVVKNGKEESNETPAKDTKGTIIERSYDKQPEKVAPAPASIESIAKEVDSSLAEDVTATVVESEPKKTKKSTKK
jgi:hypothetical protein